MTKQEIYRNIIEKNGTSYQVTIAIEELSELTKELTKLIRGKPSYKDICEEIGDVEICLEQLKIMIPRAALQIAMFKRFKLDRLQKLYIEGVEK